MPIPYRPFYHRHLPHIQPPGAALFITFRLKDSLSQAVVDELMAEQEKTEHALSRIADPVERARQAYLEERRMFGKWDAALDVNQGDRRWLEDTRVAQVVVDSLHYRDGKVYDLEAFSVMPTHVHLVCTPSATADGAYHSLTGILHSLKRHTAREANRILGREGAFWQPESYDHVVRNEAELQRIVEYVLNNPVKAGLCAAWEDWPWNYCRSDWQSDLREDGR